jgi:hypothetical protein
MENLDYIGLISSAAAAIGLVFNGITFLKNRQMNETRTIAEVVLQINELGKQLGEVKGQQESILWYDRFFNTLEWFAFLVNTDRLKDWKQVQFLGPAIINYYDELLPRYQNLLPEDKRKDLDFTELKTLYDKLKEINKNDNVQAR